MWIRTLVPPRTQTCLEVICSLNPRSDFWFYLSNGDRGLAGTN
ncbi:MAG: hypothetical protein ACTS6G_01445 [Candidatus Hodgkinia cicadicola]